MSSEFRFQEFTVRHDRCAMKVGTDAILLGAWTRVDRSRRLLDIGTGSGIIALMLAQRAPMAVVDAVEIDPRAAEQARENFCKSPWPDRLHLHALCITQYCPDQQFDVIVSNPPWFRESLHSPDFARTTARHLAGLTDESLCANASRLLHPEGRFSVVLPASDEQRFECTAEQFGLYCCRRCDIFPTPFAPAKRILMEFSRVVGMRSPPRETLVVETNQRHDYSSQFRDLTRDFYLRFRSQPDA